MIFVNLSQSLKSGEPLNVQRKRSLGSASIAGTAADHLKVAS